MSGINFGQTRSSTGTDRGGELNDNGHSGCFLKDNRRGTFILVFIRCIHLFIHYYVPYTYGCVTLSSSLWSSVLLLRHIGHSYILAIGAVFLSIHLSPFHHRDLELLGKSCSKTLGQGHSVRRCKALSLCPNSLPEWRERLDVFLVTPMHSSMGSLQRPMINDRQSICSLHADSRHDWSAYRGNKLTPVWQYQLSYNRLCGGCLLCCQYHCIIGVARSERSIHNIYTHYVL